MTFTVTYAQRDDAGACLRLAGELDVSTAPELDAALARLAESGERHLLVDLAELTFCDSTGIAAFVRGENRAAAQGGWLRVANATGRVERVLRMTGLADVLGHRPDTGHPTSQSAP